MHLFERWTCLIRINDAKYAKNLSDSKLATIQTDTVSYYNSLFVEGRLCELRESMWARKNYLDAVRLLH